MIRAAQIGVCIRLKCKEYTSCRKGWFKSKLDAHISIGVKEPFVIEDINTECTEYKDRKFIEPNCASAEITQLMRTYDIPFPIYAPGEPFNIINAIDIIYRLKEIAKDINWETDKQGHHSEDAQKFMYLIEKLAGTRGANKLCALIFSNL